MRRKSDRMLMIELRRSVDALSAAVGDLAEAQRSLARAKSRTLYAQLEDLAALYREIDPEGSLPRMRGWAAGPELLRFLYEEVVGHGRSRVLECGSGTTTVILAHAVRRLGSGRVVALEHDPHYAALTRRELRERGLSEWAEVADAPLCEVELGGRTWPWYDRSAVPDGPVDLLVVDGPPGATGPQARYPAVPLVADRLTERAVVVLDDARREDERRIARRWVAEHPGLEARFLGHDRGTVVLRRRAD